jgi:formate hydrogenlyase subunit 4
VRKVSGARQHPTTLADNAKALGYLFARISRAKHARTLLPAVLASVPFGFVLVRVRVLAGSRDAHKATARTLARLRATYQWHGQSVATVLAASAYAVLVAHHLPKSGARQLFS